MIRSRRIPGGDEYHFRTYSSAGALYPVEVYAATADGLFHFHPREQALRRLRSEDVRGALADAEIVLAQTGILWRTAWKYEARGYRHLFWDAGTMLANLLELTEGARVVTGFVDEDVNRVLGVDGEREAALVLLALGRADPPPAPRLDPLQLEVAPLSARETQYPEAHALHRASRLESAEDVARYRANGGAESTSARLDGELERILRRRGSIRAFARAPIPRDELAALLAYAMGPIPLDVPANNHVVLIANEVDGLDPGAYRFHPPDGFEQLRRGDLRPYAGYLVLEQPLGALAAATLFLTADLDAVLDRHGNRGYRAAQLEAGIRTGRIYLGAFARGWGATASTFYDDEVSRFFATSESPLLAAAVGRR